MKLIITGATGFVATEVIRQALMRHDVTSIVAVARSPAAVPPSVPPMYAKKMESVLVQDYGTYNQEIKESFKGTDAVVWTVAITPSKARALPASEVKKVCHDWTVAGFDAILSANQARRGKISFLYVSGTAASDPARPHPKDTHNWIPANMREYAKMRGETATRLSELEEQSDGRVKVCIAKPGFITGGQRGFMRNMFGTALWATGVDTIDVKEVAAAMLESVVQGFGDADGVLTNKELLERGRSVLQNRAYSIDQCA